MKAENTVLEKHFDHKEIEGRLLLSPNTVDFPQNLIKLRT